MTEIKDQPTPVLTEGRPVWDLVVEDMRARDALGRVRYGAPLQAFNGRDQLVDAYQEVLDLAVYLRAAIEEISHMRAEHAQLKHRLGAK